MSSDSVVSGMVPSFEDASAHVLKKHAKSFHWASWFLPAERLKLIQELYHFCRFADDVADELEPSLARERLETLSRAIDGEDWSALEPRARAMIRDLRNAGVQPEWMKELIKGVSSDLEPVVVRDQRELIRYCYRVAGVVGLMMCPLLGVHDPRAYPFAIDLGVAMQLTNIARDVAEDATRGRVYLPATWLGDVGTDSSQVLSGGLSDVQIRTLLARCLALADIYYESGRCGLMFIPWQPRLAIAVAATLYQSIGGRLKRALGLNPWLGRAYVGKFSKIRLTLMELVLQGFKMTSRRGVQHQRHLHVDLQGLPEVRA